MAPKLFSMFGQWGDGGGGERNGGGLWEEDTCWLLEKTRCTTTLRFLGYLFLQALMVRNSEQIIGVAKSFFCFQELRRL